MRAVFLYFDVFHHIPSPGFLSFWFRIIYFLLAFKTAVIVA
jgi:hypothetical protein